MGVVINQMSGSGSDSLQEKKWQRLRLLGYLCW